MGLTWLLWRRMKRPQSQKVGVTPLMERYPVVSFMNLVTSWVVLTDDGYVLEFGRQYGAFLLLATVATLQPQQQKHMVLLLFLLAVCSELSPWACEDPEHLPTRLVRSGVYFNAHNPTVNRTVSIWQETLPEYSQVATPWQWTGDARTGMSYFLNYVDRDPVFYRVWLPTEDEEFVALDVAFPDDGHSWEKPLYLVLHGLNGGSTEGYVIDFARSRNREGSTVVVMIARGLDDTPLQGWTFFHGARTIDAHSAATILRDRVKGSKQVLAGVGYSLGAIVLNHYVSSARENVALDVSVSISGALACNYQETFVRSRRIWQPVIVAHMKEHFFVSKWGHRLYHQLGREKYQQLLRARHIVESDRYAGVLYNGYKDHDHFYAAMSSVLFHPQAMAHNISTGYFSIPHLILQALDDPISTWRTITSNDPDSPLFPSNLVNRPETQNVVILLTEKGGHFGWPVGWKPHSWIYMNDWVAANFVSAYAKKHNLLGCARGCLEYEDS